MEQETENKAGSETQDCPRCAETIKKAALFCRYCGTDLNAFRSTLQAEVEQMLFDGHPAVIYSVWQWIPVVLTLGLVYLYYVGQSMSVRYQISTQRIRIERGLATKEKNSLELFTIEHFDIVSQFGMRMEGYCILRLRSTDTSTPYISIYGISGLEKLADRLRECALRERTRRRILSVMPT